MVWKWIVNSDYGLLNFVLRNIGLQPLKIMETPVPAFLMMCFIVSWRTVGYIMILVLSGLKALPEDMLEAARLTGANYIQRNFPHQIPNIKSHSSSLLS
jgi:multiple sugar transport system permease protein